jgi:hypothetical protein
MCTVNVTKTLPDKGRAIPEQALMIPGGRGSQISKQGAHEHVKILSPTHRHLYSPGNIPGTHSV